MISVLFLLFFLYFFDDLAVAKVDDVLVGLEDSKKKLFEKKSNQNTSPDVNRVVTSAPRF